jgi:hypothetical protein
MLATTTKYTRTAVVEDDVTLNASECRAWLQASANEWNLLVRTGKIKPARPAQDRIPAGYSAKAIAKLAAQRSAG